MCNCRATQTHRVKFKQTSLVQILTSALYFCFICRSCGVLHFCQQEPAKGWWIIQKWWLKLGSGLTHVWHISNLMYNLVCFRTYRSICRSFLFPTSIIGTLHWRERKQQSFMHDIFHTSWNALDSKIERAVLTELSPPCPTVFHG